MGNFMKKWVNLFTALCFFLYIVTDSMELIQGGFSSLQLTLTYIAMAGIPFSMMGLYAMEAKRGGWLYLTGLLLIAVSFIYFAGTAIWALAERTGDYGFLVERLGFTYLLHGVLLVIGGMLTGLIMVRRRLVPLPIGMLLIIASLMSLLTGALQLPETGYVAANYVRNGAFVILGIWNIAMLRQRVISHD